MKSHLLLLVLLAGLFAPLRALPPNDAVVVFNEIHYNPTGTGEAGEWIELFNMMGVSVDMSDWRIAGGVDYAFAAGTVIPAGGHLVIAKTPGGIAGSMGPFTGALSNSGDTLRLLDNNDRAMDEMTYGDKGEWPVAPDGGGATLAKRDAFSGSARAGNWMASAQVGGTPGVANFPPPPPPVTTRVIGQSSVWKYHQAAQAAGWQAPAFSEAGWSSGTAGFQFGNPQIYMDAPATGPGGIWSVLTWTGDVTSGVSSAKSYTHKIGLNRAGGYTAINGVTFDSPGSNVTSGATWTLLGATSPFTGNANNLPAGTGSRQLCEEFFYGNSYNGKSRLELTGLTSGQGYIATFYATGYGEPPVRRNQITPSDGSTPYIVDENATGSGNGLIVKYHYTASGNGTIAFDFLPLDAGTWHHYAFSNEVATAPPIEAAVAGVAISDFSSQRTTGFTRAAVNCANGSGISGQTHGTTADGTMWQSNGMFIAPYDQLPAVITFDLGSTVHLTSFHVWNYNESGAVTAGANAVEVLVATNAAGPFTSAGTLSFIKASGLTTEPGQHFEFDRTGVRYVRFNITSNHGDTNQFAGLSEVKFYMEGTPPAQTPIPYREKIGTLFNTGIAANGTLATPGTGDPHYTNITSSTAAVVQIGHPAWLGADGISQWTGLTGSGTDDMVAGQFTWRTTANLSGYQLGSVVANLYVSSDNSLDNVLLNGVSKGIATGGFNGYFGPFAVTGWAAGANTVDFLWSNAGGPGGFRVKWEATAQPLLANTTLPSNPVTTYFRQKFTYNGNPASAYRLLLNYIADDGAVFYLNGTELHRVRVTGSPTSATLADSDVVYPKFSGALEIPVTALVTGENTLAVELHQSSVGNADAFFLATLDLIETLPATSSSSAVTLSELAGAADATWFAELRNTSAATVSLTGFTLSTSGSASYYTFGAGATLAAGAVLSLDQTALGFRPLDGDKFFLTAPGIVADAQVVKNSAQARDASGRWLTPSAATPGSANTFSIPSAIVINEIMYHHAPAYLATGITESAEEWVELYNKSASPVVLTGWKLSGGIGFDFVAGTQIPAGGYLVVSNNPAALLAKFPGITVTGSFSGSLSHSDEVVTLEDASGNPADEVHYYDSGRWDERADGGGSSLELRNPGADNSAPEAWAASDESGKAAWQTFTYTGTGAPPPGSSDPTAYNELVVGLLNGGEFLLDDVSVIEVSVGNRQCIQNGNFSDGTANFWRNIGTHGSHGRTVVVDDPAAPGNKVLKVVATGATEHMHNHCETTLKSSGSYVPLNSANTYTVSFRARWVSGTPRLNTRLYFNRLARQSILPIPQNTGSPGAQNSRFSANPGPTFSALAHAPVLPDANAPVTVSVRAADPQNVASVSLKWKVDGALTFNSVAMALNGDRYEGTIPAQSAGTLAQFYIEAADGSAGVSAFPAAGANSRALIRWKDGLAPLTLGHGVRILLPAADANFLHEPTNAMSNDFLPCTVVYRESEVHYDAAVRLKSSQRGRPADIRLGFAVNFDPMHAFRGTHTTINLDRSAYGRGTTGSGFGQSDIVSWHFMNRAGGVPSMYNDLAYLIAPRSVHNGSAQLTMAEFNDVWLDSQFPNGAATPTFKYELIYYPTTTVGNSPEGLKLPSPDDVLGVEFGQTNTSDKEAHRWNFLIGNARDRDDYTRIVNLNDTYRLTGAAFNAAIPNAIDVDQWLRASAALALAGVGDNYITSSGAWHNLKLYHRADGRILYLPWDLDFQTQPFDAPLIINPDISAITGASAANQRLFYQHLQDIIATSFNTSYLTAWVNHYQALTTTGGNWADILTYVDARVAFVNAQIAGAYPNVPFAITTNGGANFSAPGPNVTLTGNGWINVRTIRVLSSGLVLDATWTSGSAWQVSLPIAPGANAVTLQAFDYQGNLVGSDSITITGTGTVVPAAAGNVVVSELHYNPAAVTAGEISAGYSDKDDFEFIELRNTGAQTVNLAGCHFTGGMDYTFPAVTLAPGAYAVIARRSAAFAMRHPGVTPLGEYYQAGVNFLSNGGEEVALTAASSADIARFSYGDSLPWPASPDGTGPSLVLIAPKTNPDPANPLHWRASAASHGNPGASDAPALPANLLGDNDGDGIKNITEHAIGAGAFPSIGRETVLGASHVTFTLERAALADVSWDLESSTALAGWVPAGAAYEITVRSALPGGVERVTLRALAPASGPAYFLRGKLTAQP